MMCENGPIQKTYELNGNASLRDSFCQHHQLHKRRFTIPKVNISQLLKWKETAFMKSAVTSELQWRILWEVTASFFFSFFPQGMKGNYNCKGLAVKIVAWLLSESGFSYTVTKELGKKKKRFSIPFPLSHLCSLNSPKSFYMWSCFLWYFSTFSCQAVIPSSFIPGCAGIMEF